MECSTGDTMTAKERENLMNKVRPLENKLSNNKKCPGKNSKKQEVHQVTVEVDRPKWPRTALDNHVGGPCEQSKSEKWCAKKKCGKQNIWTKCTFRPSFLKSMSVTTCAPSRERYHILQ